MPSGLCGGRLLRESSALPRSCFHLPLLKAPRVLRIGMTGWTWTDFADWDGWVGTIMTVGFFASPIPTCWRIAKRKDAELFSPVPYLVAFFNCVLWCYYCVVTGVVEANLIPNLSCNAIGAGLEVCYVLCFLAFSRTRRLLMSQVAVVCALLAMLILFFELVVPTSPKQEWDMRWWSTTLSSKSSVIGLVTDVINIGMYGSPLVVMAQVIRTKSNQYLPLGVSAMGFTISALWAAQGLALQNKAVLIPNILGVILNAGQLLLWTAYQDRDRASEAQERLRGATNVADADADTDPEGARC